MLRGPCYVLCRLCELFEYLVGEFDPFGLQVLLQMANARSSRDEEVVGRMIEQPGEGQLVRGDAELFRDLFEGSHILHIAGIHRIPRNKGLAGFFAVFQN